MSRISMSQGKGSQLHNRREYKKIGKSIPNNIDVSKSHENIILIDLDIKEVYREIFGEALDKYNRKQKRADRKIESYYEHIKKSKNGEKLFYEDVIQWGSKEDFQTQEMRKKAEEALVKYAEGFEMRNPNLKLIGAYIHMDEASPHLHLDYIPVAHGYKRGLETRNSLDKAMKEMGFQPEKESRKNNATKLWKENERTIFRKICCELGLNVEAERKARGSLSVEEYKEARDKMIREIEQEYAVKKEQIKNIDEIVSYIAFNTSDPINVEDMTIPPKKSVFGKITAPERVGVFVESMDKVQIEALIQRVYADEAMTITLERTQEQCRCLIAKAQKEAQVILAEATAECNQTIAEAEQIVREKQNIISKAKVWAENQVMKAQVLVDKIRSMIVTKQKLEDEIANLQDIHQTLEPLQIEVQELKRVRDMLHGDLDNELIYAKFKDWDTMPYGSDYNIYRERGELLAFYKDGTIRKVGFNEYGGFDNKTLDDQAQGLCRVGIMQEEEQIKVPISLLQELIQNMDRTKIVSQRLESLIRRQIEVFKIIGKRKGQLR